jgi:hypothetical protein
MRRHERSAIASASASAAEPRQRADDEPTEIDDIEAGVLLDERLGGRERVGVAMQVVLAFASWVHASVFARSLRSAAIACSRASS